MNSIRINLIVLLVPVLSSIVAMLLILMDILEGSHSNRRLRLKLGFYLFCIGISWVSSFLYFYSPSSFVYINWFMYWCFLSIPVLLYAFVFDLTVSPFSDGRFPIVHYILPTVISLFLLILTLITPFSTQLEIIKSREGYTGKSSLFYSVTNSKFIVRFVFSVFYVFLSFKRLPPYRRSISNFSSDIARNNLKWVAIFLIMATIVLPIPLLGVLVSKKILSESSIIIVHVCLIVLQQSYLSFHMVKSHFVTKDDLDNLMLNEKEERVPITSDLGDEKVTKIPIIAQKEFEKYIFTEKPYLNSQLKITDLVIGLGVNRTYISSFINTQYKMNFCKFVNQCRVKEFKELKRNPEYSNRNDNELAELAGFNNYRSYKRFMSDGTNRETFLFK